MVRLKAGAGGKGQAFKAQTSNHQPVPKLRSYHGLPLSLLLLPTQGDSRSPSELWSFWGAVAAMTLCEPTSCC